MKLAEISRGHLRIIDGTKTVTIYGEALLSTHGSADFVLYQNSIKNWDVPNAQEEVTPAEKEELIRFLKDEFSRRHMVLEIE